MWPNSMHNVTAVIVAIICGYLLPGRTGTTFVIQVLSTGAAMLDGPILGSLDKLHHLKHTALRSS